MAQSFSFADGKGRVELLDVFGSDVTVVNAARVSFGKEVTVMEERDKKLLNYLAKHNHISPFFHPQIRFRLKMPIFVAREWFRHQIGLSRNEVSRRYVDTDVECWVPSLDDLRERDPKAKQGSKATPIAEAETIHEVLKAATEASMATYNRLLEANVAPEVARCILPQSMYTEFIETGSLYAYARICALRLDPTAQKETRAYATAIDAMLIQAFPNAWNALRQPWIENIVTVATASPASSASSVTAPPATVSIETTIQGLAAEPYMSHESPVNYIV